MLYILCSSIVAAQSIRVWTLNAEDLDDARRATSL